MARIKEYPSIESFDGNADALAIEQTDGANNRTRKVSPAQLKNYMQSGDFTATGEIKDGHGNILNDMAQSKATHIHLGNITASSDTEALGKAWDSLTVFSQTVIVTFGRTGQFMAMMYKYPDSQYGMAIAMKYLSANIYTMSVVGGVKSYATK